MTEKILSFIDISLHVIIISGNKGIQHGKDELKDDADSNDIGGCGSKITVNNLYSHLGNTSIRQNTVSKILQHDWRQEDQNSMIQPLFH